HTRLTAHILTSLTVSLSLSLYDALPISTSKPKLATTIYEQAKEKGIHALDAPVSGGDVGAKNAKLTIMVGGEKAAYDAVLPIRVDRKSTRLNSSHVSISYAVFCLKNKK